MDLKKLDGYKSILLKKDVYEKREIKCCPICGANKYIKYGLYKQIQRYMCKECGKTFSNATNALWSYSKKSFEKWIEFTEFMMEKKSLRFCAEKLNISLVTAFYWRHKILRGLKLDIIPNKLRGDIHINKTIIIENLKGCRNITTARRSNIWIIAAKGDEDSMVIMPIFRNCWSWQIFDEKIYSKIQKGSYIVAYKDRYIFVKAKQHNKKMVKDIKYDDRIAYIMRNLNKWLSTFHGVATKYLDEYLSLFILFNLDRMFDYMDMMSYLSIGSRFTRTREIRT